MTRFFAAFLALLCASVAVSSACAAAQDAPAPQLVPYGDLDLSTPGGKASLHRRIERAIDKVCADPTGPSPAVTVNATCKAEAWADVQRKTEIAMGSRAKNARTALLISIPKH